MNNISLEDLKSSINDIEKKQQDTWEQVCAVFKSMKPPFQISHLDTMFLCAIIQNNIFGFENNNEEVLVSFDDLDLQVKLQEYDINLTTSEIVDKVKYLHREGGYFFVDKKILRCSNIMDFVRTELTFVNGYYTEAEAKYYLDRGVKEVVRISIRFTQLFSKIIKNSIKSKDN